MSEFLCGRLTNDRGWTSEGNPDVFFRGLFESSHLFVIHSVSPFYKKEKLHVVSTSFLPSFICSSLHDLSKFCNTSSLIQISEEVLVKPQCLLFWILLLPLVNCKTLGNLSHWEWVQNIWNILSYSYGPWSFGRLLHVWEIMGYLEVVSTTWKQSILPGVRRQWGTGVWSQAGETPGKPFTSAGHSGWRLAVGVCQTLDAYQINNYKQIVPFTLCWLMLKLLLKKFS